MALLLFLSANTHKPTRGERWGAPCPSVPVSLGWDISVETADPAGAGAVGLRSLATGWNYLSGVETADAAVQAEVDERVMRAVQAGGVPVGVALDAIEAAIVQAETELGKPLTAMVAYNAEFIASVFRRFPPHPLATRVLAVDDTALRKVCLCWDVRCRSEGKPARFVDLCKKYGIERDPAINPVQPVLRIFTAMRADGTLGDVAAMRHDSDPRTPGLYLNVPYGQREEAKRLGAMFDGVKKLWYLPASVVASEAGLPEMPADWTSVVPAGARQKRQREDAE